VYIYTNPAQTLNPKLKTLNSKISLSLNETIKT